MFIESITLTNFRCFGSTPQTIRLSKGLTCLVGANGAGKTALMLALLRMFGISAEQRRVRRRDFHVPADEKNTPAERTLAIEAIFAFPELPGDDEDDGDDTDDDGNAISTVPQFFHQMAADENGTLKCRIRLDATWTDDGSVDGAIEERFYVIRTLTSEFEEQDCIQLKHGDRARIQMIYVPAVRDGSAQVAAFLRSRLWRAVVWSQSMHNTLEEAGTALNDTFGKESAVAEIEGALQKRWGEIHEAGINATPSFRLIDLRFSEFISKVEIVFRPDEQGRDASLDELSDGQRSLFYIAMTSATLDVESQIKKNPFNGSFKAGDLTLPTLTLLAVEEPENNLSPFYLSRILQQIKNVVGNGGAQAVVSSHSASILGRVAPEDVRYFRLDPQSRTASVKGIRLPKGDEDAEKFVREAVRTYPELYFARFVILGEGSSEEVVLPRIAEAMDLAIDRSFVAIVPLGGRHVNHLWRLLKDLEIPYATLLDLDYGRAGGGWGRIKNICGQLLAVGVSATALLGHRGRAVLSKFDAMAIDDYEGIESWVKRLQKFNVFFCVPLDLDMTMVEGYFSEYQVLAQGMRGPKSASGAKVAVLGEEGSPDLYDQEWDDKFSWYRYLFLGRSKPSTHVRVLGKIALENLKNGVPEPLDALLELVKASLPVSLGQESAQ